MPAFYKFQAVMRAARFGSVTSGLDWSVSGTDDHICFTVDQDDVIISGVGVYLSAAKTPVTVNIALTQVEPEEILRTVLGSLQPSGTSAVHDFVFPRPISIKNNVRYMISARFFKTKGTFKGENGKSTVAGEDGTTFTFHDAPGPDNGTSTTYGQIPDILYCRDYSERAEWTSESSYERALTEIRFPLKEEIDKSSEQMKLNRFKLSVRVVKEKTGKLQTTVICHPIKDYPKWSVEVQALCRLVHPTARSKSRQFYKRGTVTSETPSVTIFKLDAAQLADWVATKETVLEATIRYAKATSPPDVPAENQCSFEEPWRGSDLVLSFDDGKKLHTHRQILSIASTVLHRMLDGDFKEKTESTIPLPGKDSAGFEKLLRLIYPRETPRELNYDDAFQLAELFHEYEMERMEQRTENILVDEADESNVFGLLKLACRIHFEDLKERCLRLCTELSNEDLKKDPDYYLLDGDVRELVQDARMFHAQLE